MIGDVPIVTFDTSAHNRLADDPRSELVIARINSGLSIRFAGSSVEELYACPNPRRGKLFASCRRLQCGPSECLLPSNLLIRKLILAHFNDPANFDWNAINVRYAADEELIRNYERFDNEQVSEMQREFQKARRALDKQQRERQRGSLRPRIQEIFRRHGETPPAAFQPAFTQLRDGRSAAVAAWAQHYCDLVTTIDTDKATAEKFMDACPPFRALVYAKWIPWYNTAVREYSVGDELSAGINDLYMSVYLPYCDMFITGEKYGQQEKCLREVAVAAGLETKVLSYDDFCDDFMVAA
jgi:hypothetical protein